MRAKVILLLPMMVLASIATVYKLTDGPATASAPVARENACQDEACEDAACEQEPDGQKTPAIEGLRLERAVEGEAWDVVTATGIVAPNAEKVVAIGPRIAGRVVNVLADIGDIVSQGTVLATVSSTELAQARAAYRQAEAEVRVATEHHDRQVKLAELGVFSRRPVEEARADLMAAEGDLAEARSSLAGSESDLGRCAARLARARDLYQDQIVSRQDLEDAEAEHARDRAAVDAARAKVKQAEARVEVARGYVNREEQVLRGGLLASKEVQAAQADLTRAELGLRAAAEGLRVLGASPSGSGDTLSVTSPISGRVVARSATAGQMVDPAGTLFTVMELSEVWVEAAIYEKDLARVRAGQAVQVRVEAFPDRVFEGVVSHVGDVLDPGSRTATLRCVMGNADHSLKPQMFASVTVITEKRSKAVLIPTAAVLDDGGRKVVFLPCTDCPEQCGEFDRREVAVGPAHGDRVEVVGVEAGEEVVTDGNYQLKTALSAGRLEAGCTDD